MLSQIPRFVENENHSFLFVHTAIHLLVTSKYSTPQILKDPNLDFLKLSIKDHEWVKYIALDGNEKLYNAVTQPDGVFVVILSLAMLINFLEYMWVRECMCLVCQGDIETRRL